jgi:hypothetical protein
VRVALIEDASRFARDLIAQELGIVVLLSRTVRVITANGDDLCDTSDPTTSAACVDDIALEGSAITSRPAIVVRSRRKLTCGSQRGRGF